MIRNGKILSVLLLLSLASSGIAQTGFPVKRTENRETWLNDGWSAIQRAKAVKPNTKRAKNVILFIGDGMGVTTLTAARILEGQIRGESGEENRLSFEEFPYSAFSKTYSTNQQTSDSAPTMSAMITGVKTGEGLISVSQSVLRNRHELVKGNETESLLARAEKRGLSTGVVSTARLTHATPAACYAHSPNRDWESDKDIFDRSKPAHAAGFPDIARQLIEFPHGDGIDVALGGGRTKFLPQSAIDPEYPERKGERLDSRDLAREWSQKTSKSEYVWNKAQFDAVNPKTTKRLLGLFERSHVQYEFDRSKDPAGEPSLSEMTAKSIDILSQNKKGFFLMVEAGRIDHAHHEGNAFRALRDTIELSNAVRTALSKVNLEETLIIVTADHSHTFTMAGYPVRGNNVLGLVREVDDNGMAEEKTRGDKNGMPYTTLGYINGLGYRGGKRPDLTDAMVIDPNFLQEAAVPLTSETHGGEDVAIFAAGPGSYLVRGSMEQNWIYHVMADAMRLK